MEFLDTPQADMEILLAKMAAVKNWWLYPTLVEMPEVERAALWEELVDEWNQITH